MSAQASLELIVGCSVVRCSFGVVGMAVKPFGLKSQGMLGLVAWSTTLVEFGRGGECSSTLRVEI
ncbi:MAG: hypothetical protein R3C03_15950 [Pirellulaceae bacterium]